MTFFKKTFESTIGQLYSELWQRVNHITPILNCEKNSDINSYVKYNGIFYNRYSLFKPILREI